jgi:transcription-repair coupling factor (superfamily II helicase)
VNINPFQARFLTTESSQLHWCGLAGSSTALAIEQAARAHRGLTLVVTRSSHQSQILEHDIGLMSDGELPLLHFPDYETLPYDPFSPHPDIIAERLSTLSRLARLKHGVLLVPVSTLMQRLPPQQQILGRSLSLETGQTLNIASFREQLHVAGYSTSDQVYQPGQFCIRGSVIDLFPPDCGSPLRLDLFDDEIDSIRYFDADSQRSGEKLTSFNMLPAREYACNPASFDAFRKAFRLRFAVDMRRVTLYQDLRAGIHPQGLENYLPLFYESTSTLLDYLPGVPVQVLQEDVVDAAKRFWKQVHDRWEQRRHDLERPVLDPSELFCSADEIINRLNNRSSVILAGKRPAGGERVDFDTRAAPDLHIHERGREPAAALQSFSNDFSGRVIFAADTPGRREVIHDTLKVFGIHPVRYDSWAEFRTGTERLALLVMPVEEGFICGTELAVLTETQLFGGRARPRSTRAASDRDPESIIRDLSDLDTGVPVVHEDQGIGRYQGLKTLEIDGRPAEFLLLEYAGEDKLYVPVSSLHLVSRYTGGSPETAPLHRLGSEQWSKARRRAAKKVRDVAAELLDLYARRLARKGHSFPLDPKLYAEFSSGFQYEETPDQLSAFTAIIDDMELEQPMDRVICGDVGFGKTEVALRAAFVAIQGGKQVALLVPTTLLAQQHFNTFSDRFADWPVRIELLSRFRSGKQAKTVLDDLATGRVDLVIGTHRLIQRDIRFERLGLVIVDEEQRFGVRQKEQLKQLRTEVDMLTLTATPIPRTLNMAMSGIRDLSIIATPPQRRIAVKTVVAEWDRALLREALLREIQRGGQVFFLHNEVHNIERIAREVRELVPESRVEVAHGQMGKGELEQVMLDFYRQRFNVLVCTTIIENGIDVPTANTIIINRADRFGLAQLHQLRGRVGRSHHRAYAYLLSPGRKSITRDAQKRLDAITALDELGAGFTLATHDMEIRGTGELLGDEQSGQIQQIGFSLYSELLARAVEALRDGREPELEMPLNQGIEIELHLAALIPETWLGDVHLRLTLYKRIASAGNPKRLRDLQVEMIDRFGLLPDEAKNLFEVAELRLLAEAIGITRLDFGPHGGRIEFAADASANPEALLMLVHGQPLDYQLQGPQRLRILTEEPDDADRLKISRHVLERLGQKS